MIQQQFQKEYKANNIIEIMLNDIMFERSVHDFCMVYLGNTVCVLYFLEKVGESRPQFVQIIKHSRWITSEWNHLTLGCVSLFHICATLARIWGHNY